MPIRSKSVSNRLYADFASCSSDTDSQTKTYREEKETNTESDEDTGQRIQSGLKLDYEGTQVVTTKLQGGSTWIIEGLELALSSRLGTRLARSLIGRSQNWTKPVQKPV